MLQNPAFWTALVGLISAAIVVPAVKHFIWDVAKVLKVTVRLYPILESKWMETVIAEMSRIEKTHDLQVTLLRARSALDVEIRNESKKRIDNITLKTPEGEPLIFQLDGGEMRRVSAEPIPLGNLQPHHAINFRIWFRFEADTLALVRDAALRISADEIDRVRMRWPFPRYAKMLLFSDRKVIILAAVFIGGIVAFGIFR